MRALGVRDTGSTVVYAHDHVIGFVNDVHANGLTGTILDGIFDEIDDRLMEFVGVGEDRRGTRSADSNLATACVPQLAARVNAALRRPHLRDVDGLAYADLSLDTATRDVRRGTQSIATTAREFDLLLTLARHPGRVFTRAQLIEHVWGTEHDVQSGTLEGLISELRSKIDRPPFERLIQTIRGVGYVLRSPRID